MYYFKRYWDESRGDEFDSWGASLWWLELDSEGYTIRCLHEYENGNSPYYSEDHLENEYGGLPESLLDLTEFKEFSISKNEFELAINNATPINLLISSVKK